MEGVEKAPIMQHWGAIQYTLLKAYRFKSKPALDPDSSLLPSRIKLLKNPIALSNEHKHSVMIHCPFSLEYFTFPML